MANDTVTTIKSNKAAHNILNNFHPDFVFKLKQFIVDNAKDAEEAEILADMVCGTARYIATEDYK